MTRAKKWLSRVAEKLSPSPAPDPTLVSLVAETRGLFLSSITGYPEVEAATLTEDEGQVGIVLMLESTTHVGVAARLGDNAVRMAKSFLEPGTVGKQVGKGAHEYIIEVYRSDGEPIAKGRKSKGSKDIRWPRTWLSCSLCESEERP